MPTPPNACSHSLWRGHDRLDFTFNGRPCLLVSPSTPAPGKPWIWRTEFFDHEPQFDLAMLDHGWHVTYFKVSDMYGAPPAIKEMRAYHAHLERSHGLAPKAVLEGFSRGGLYAFNYAAAHPDKVSALYLDAPVLDIRSWPCGRKTGEVYARLRAECLAIYGLTEQTLSAFRGSPLDQVDKVASAGIPIISVCGGADESVPFEENTAILEKRYRQLGGVIEVILKKDCGHHPHSLPDPKPITAFVLRHATP